jgi:hypothetical protein
MEENEEKFRELEEKIEALEELIEEGSESHEEPGFIDIQTTGGEDFRLFWVNIGDIDTYETCEEVDSVAKAQIVFKEYALVDGTVKSGDVFVLLCNRMESEESEDSDEDTPPVCYFIGMCVLGGTPSQEPSLSEIPSKADQYEFIAWDTCGGAEESCPEELDDDGNPIPPTTVDMTEVTAPTLSDTGGTLLTEYTQYSETSSSLGSFITELDVEESDDDDEKNTIDFLELSYPIINDSAERFAVAVKHTPKILKHKKISPLKSAVKITNTVTQFAKKVIRTTTLPFKKITLASDKCGNLSREPDPDQGSYEPDSTQEIVQEIGDASGTVSITSAALSTESEDEDSENVIESTSVEDIEDSGYEFSDDDVLVIPQINTTQSQTLQETDSVDYVEKIALEGTPAVDSSGSDNHVVTIKLKPTVKTANYASGLYLNTEDTETLSQPFEIKFNIPKAEEPDPDSGTYKVIDICEDGETVPIRVRVYPSEEE